MTAYGISGGKREVPLPGENAEVDYISTSAKAIAILTIKGRRNGLRARRIQISVPRIGVPGAAGSYAAALVHFASPRQTLYVADRRTLTPRLPSLDAIEYDGRTLAFRTGNRVFAGPPGNGGVDTAGCFSEPG